jgi:hypothetical protein
MVPPAVFVLFRQSFEPSLNTSGADQQMPLCKSAPVAESLKRLLGSHLNRPVQGVTASTAQAEGSHILTPRARAAFLFDNPP